MQHDEIWIAVCACELAQRGQVRDGQITRQCGERAGGERLLSLRSAKSLRQFAERRMRLSDERGAHSHTSSSDADGRDIDTVNARSSHRSKDQTSLRAGCHRGQYRSC